MKKQISSKKKRIKMVEISIMLNKFKLGDDEQKFNY